MKIFENKSIFKKILIVFIIVLIASFCFSGKVQADNGELGGKLLSPVMSLFVTLGDGIMTILQDVILNMSDSLIQIDSGSSGWADFLVGAVAVLAVVGVVVATVLTAGAAARCCCYDCGCIKGNGYCTNNSWCCSCYISCSNNCCRGNVTR